jgi:hypothetical protein
MTVTINGTSGITSPGGDTNVSQTSSGNQTAAALIPSGSTAPTNGVFLPASNSVGIATNSAERMRIAADGRVSIGQTIQSARLTIKNASDSYQYGGIGLVNGANSIWNIVIASTSDLYFGWNFVDRAYIRATDGAYIQISDRRLKKDVLECRYGLESVMALRPVEYLMNDQAEGSTKNIGFIAQEVNEVIDEVVTQSANEGELYCLNMSSLIPVLTKAIQELSAKVDAQQAEIEALKGVQA